MLKTVGIFYVYFCAASCEINDDDDDWLFTTQHRTNISSRIFLHIPHN